MKVRTLCAAMVAWPALAFSATPPEVTSGSLNAMTARIAALEARVAKAEAEAVQQRDVEDVRRLQYTYGYYMDRQLFKQVTDLFSAKPVSVEWGGGGVYLGRAGVLRKFGQGIDQGPKFGLLREHLQLQGVIHVSPDGKTAKGRFHALILFALSPNDPVGQSWQVGIYENEYVKEDGVWKINKLDYKQVVTTPYLDGWGKTQQYSSCGPETADQPTTWYHPYPESGTFPFHYPNPVTGSKPPETVDQTRYWIGNWPGEFGKCGHR